MSSIIRAGDTFRGISVFGRGVFTDDGDTYAGQHRNGYACGLGVLAWSSGTKVYAEHGPDGQCDGRNLQRWADGATNYCLFERGKRKDTALVYADGRCYYNGVACAPDDPRVLALIALVGPVEVRPAAPSPHQPSPSTHPQAIVRWTSRLVLPPQALATAVATEVHPHAARRPWWPCDTAQQQPHCIARPRSNAFTGRFAVVVARAARPHATSCTLATAVACTPRARPGSFVAMPCQARHHTECCHARRAAHLRAHVARRMQSATLRSTPIAHCASAVGPTLRAGFAMRT